MGTHPYAYQSEQEHQIHQGQPYSPGHDQSTGQEAALNPARILRTGQDVMLPTTSAPDYPFMPPHHRQQLHLNQDLTPSSAVSSFNLPAQYSESLMTPVSITGSPPVSTRTTSLVYSDKDLKHEQLSPSALSSYSFQEEVDFGGRYNEPMKHKRPTNRMHIQTSDGGFPSTLVSPEPYFGSFGVSAPSSSRTVETPPSMSYSPSLNSAGTFSNRSYSSQHQTPQTSAPSLLPLRTLEQASQAPVLIAPNPDSLRGMNSRTSRRNSSVHSTQSAPSRGRVKKSSTGKTKKKERSNSASLSNLLLPDDLGREDLVLIELVGLKLEWKELVIRFFNATGLSLSTACLQMRKKRLVDRLMDNPINNQTPADVFNHAATNQPAPRSPRQTSSPRNWAAPGNSYSNYHANQAFPPELERLVPSDRTPRHAWAEIDNVQLSSGRLQSAQATVTMEEVRDRTTLTSPSPFFPQIREQNPNYVGFEPHPMEQRRNW